MILTVTMVVHDRPQLLKRTLASLERIWDPGWRMVVGLEPGCPEVDLLVSRMSFADPKVIRNRTVLGIEGNMRSVLKLAFGERADAVLHVEEDVELAPDAGRLVRWYLERGDRGEVALCLFGLERSGGDPGTLVRKQYFCPWGWCAFRSAWPAIQEALEWPEGWDVGLNRVMRERKLFALHPLLSRSLHTGAEGVHQRRDAYHRQFDGYQVSTGSYAGKYEVREE